MEGTLIGRRDNHGTIDFLSSTFRPRQGPNGPRLSWGLPTPRQPLKTMPDRCNWCIYVNAAIIVNFRNYFQLGLFLLVDLCVIWWSGVAQATITVGIWWDILWQF